MKVSVESRESTLSFYFEPHPGDRIEMGKPDGSMRYRLARPDCRFFLPTVFELEDCHPDLIAAVALAVCSSLGIKSLVLDKAVSRLFADTVGRFYRFGIKPVDDKLEPRKPRPASRPGLCFSGGVDSSAALLLGPDDCVPVFLERSSPPDSMFMGIYDKDAPLRACRVLKKAGWPVQAVKTDIEFLRSPVGFFNDLVMATPLILLADHLNLDSIAYGLILESAYLAKGFRYRDYAQSGHFKRYNGIAAAAGLPFNLPTAGLSELVTTRLVLESPLQHTAQSCVRGPFGRPCMMCWKCFRKNLLEASVTGEGIPKQELRRYFGMPDVAAELAKAPIKHENVIAYIAGNYRGQSEQMRELAGRLGVEELDLDWTTRWLPCSREVLAERYHKQIEEKITRLVEPMNERDIANIESWDRLPGEKGR